METSVFRAFNERNAWRASRAITNNAIKTSDRMLTFIIASLIIASLVCSTLILCACAIAASPMPGRRKHTACAVSKPHWFGGMLAQSRTVNSPLSRYDR